MSISFEGVGQVCATFLGGGLTEGQVVKMTGNGTVGTCEADDLFCGVALCCKDDACTVQVSGLVAVKYSGTAPTVGWAQLAADGNGGVKAASGGGVKVASDGEEESSNDGEEESSSDGEEETTSSGGVTCLVADVNTTAKTVTIML